MCSCVDDGGICVFWVWEWIGLERIGLDWIVSLLIVVCILTYLLYRQTARHRQPDRYIISIPIPIPIPTSRLILGTVLYCTHLDSPDSQRPHTNPPSTAQ